jgi:hypothetical protein
MCYCTHPAFVSTSRQTHEIRHLNIYIARNFIEDSNTLTSSRMFQTLSSIPEVNTLNFLKNGVFCDVTPCGSCNN